MRGLVYIKVLRWRRGPLLVLLVLVVIGLLLFPLIRGGRERGAVNALSWAVAGKVIVVDPGHGGSDPGCVSSSGVYEKNINLAVAKKLVTLLNQAGAAAVLTREGDFDLSDYDRQGSPAKRKVDDLQARVDLARDYHADLFISVHVNEYSSPRWWGAQVFYERGAEESRRLATLIQQEFIKGMGESYRWSKPEDFYVLRHAKMPAVMVETGFLSHPREGALLQDPVYQGKVAWCIYAGVVRFLSGEPLPKEPAY